MTKSSSKKEPKKEESKQSQRSNPMILGGVFLAITSIGLLVFIIKTKIF